LVTRPLDFNYFTVNEFFVGAFQLGGEFSEESWVLPIHKGEPHSHIWSSTVNGILTMRVVLIKPPHSHYELYGLETLLLLPLADLDERHPGHHVWLRASYPASSTYHDPCDEYPTNISGASHAGHDRQPGN